MPEETKKNQQKGKNEPKDQRRRRQGRQPAGTVEKKSEKQPERQIEKQSKEAEKPAYEPPGPEFYKNLKRETDEILKITEEANTKYKKKEIQSNWAKYEMPAETYEEIDEQENMGADYEKLIQAPANAGGHFQFKHEKSWDTNTGPSLYDKYFDINMDLLSLAVSTIPFYERNCLEQTMFNENDIITMNHRATKFKHKYYNDKKYYTPEVETQEKILKSLTCHSNEPDMNDEESQDMCETKCNTTSKDEDIKESSNTHINVDIVNQEQDCQEKHASIGSLIDENIKYRREKQEVFIKPNVKSTVSSKILDDSNLLFEDDAIKIKEQESKKPDIVLAKIDSSHDNKVDDEIKSTVDPVNDTPKKPVIESPEDLEKWLDDFLDG